MEDTYQITRSQSSTLLPTNYKTHIKIEKARVWKGLLTHNSVRRSGTSNAQYVRKQHRKQAPYLLLELLCNNLRQDRTSLCIAIISMLRPSIKKDRRDDADANHECARHTGTSC